MARKRTNLKPGTKRANARAVKRVSKRGTSAAAGRERSEGRRASLSSLRERMVALKREMQQLEFDLFEASPRSRKSILDRWKAAGLIGCLKDGPTDLSTNPKHMEGFGG